MSNYELVKLKEEISKLNYRVKEEEEDRITTEKRLIQVQAERDKYNEELLLARNSLENIETTIKRNVAEMKVKLEEEYTQSLSELHRKKDELEAEKRLNEKLLEENRNKDEVIS